MASRIASTSRHVLRTAAPRRCLSSSCTRTAQAASSTPSTSSSSTATPPPRAGAPASVSPKVSQIVDQISTLTLLEAADLVSALKERLNIVEIAMPAASAAAAPAAAVAGEEGGAGAAKEEDKPKEKTTFNVSLTKIDTAQKAKAIREVKAIMPSMNLVEAKKFVESLPKVLKEGATKEEAEKLQKAMKAVGAEVSLD